MKLTAIIILAFCLQVGAKGYSQTVTLSRTHVSLVTVFEEIQKQTGYNFLYTYEDLDRLGPIDVELQHVSLTEAMDRCLHNKALSYTIVEKTIVIKRKEPVPIPDLSVPAVVAPLPLLDIHGRVVDSAGNPLGGASVTIKGTNKGTKTNAKGEFDMKNVRTGMVLVISYLGFDNSEIRLVAGVEQYIISMQRSQDILDATVIQAYGTTSRRFNVGSISTVDAAAIEKQPVTNVLMALSGQAPGLTVNSINGVPGSRVLIQIRGQNTISSSSNDLSPYDQPLFLIDGVPFSPQNNNISQLGGLALMQQYSGGISAAGGMSPFNNINPADIETISILKDADATSIYGTQGSNGVVLITTKKGKAGKGAFNLTANTGFSTAARQLKLLNRDQYLQLRKDAYGADGITPGDNPNDYNSYAPDLTIFDQNKNTNWQQLIYGKTSSNTDVHASLSGGNASNTFLLSGGYTRADFNFPGRGFADQRFTIHSSLHHGSQDARLSVDFGTDYGFDQNNSPGFGGGQKILLPPNTPDLLDSAGNLLWNYKGVDLSGFQFYASLKMPTLLQNYNLNQSLRIAYHLLPGLTLSANLGYNRNTTNEKSQVPAAAQSPLYVNRNAGFANNNYQTVNVEPQLDYSITIGRGMLTALAGATYKKNTNTANQTYGYGYANDLFLGSINGAATVSNYDLSDIYKYSAGFARLKYVYDQKYIISLTGRRDGSSNFGPGHQFGNFASAGAAWIFSQEKPVKTALPFLSYGKLSGSYGTSGSDGIASYKYQSFWTPIGYVPAFQGVQPSVPDNLYNPNYSWALKKSLNLALDLGFFHDRILFNTTYYRNREGNQLGGYSLPSQAGFSSVLQNLPATVQNSGWEFSLTSNTIKTRVLTWTTNFNISFNRNKLLAFANLSSSSYASRYVIGKPVSIITGYRYKGVNPSTGLLEYYKSNGGVTNSPDYRTVAQGGDQAPIADREVKFMGGVGNTMTYRHLSLYVFFQFSSQTAPNYMATVYSSDFPGLGTSNSPVQILDHWRHPGDQTTFGKLTTNYGSETFTAASNFGASTGAYSDDTYLRLKTLSLSYSLPENWLKKMHVQDLRLYVNAQNLLTITNYKVADPEQFNDYTAMPLQRTVAFGLSFNF